MRGAGRVVGTVARTRAYRALTRLAPGVRPRLRTLAGRGPAKVAHGPGVGPLLDPRLLPVRRVRRSSTWA